MDHPAIEPVIFTEAKPADADSVAALHAESWRDTYRGILPDSFLDGPVAEDRRTVWRRRLSSAQAVRQYVLLAKTEGALAGFVCVLLDEEPSWGALLDNLHVLSRFQGRGIGRALIARAAQWVKSVQPGLQMHLWVFEQNAGARRFYDALKGRIVERDVIHHGGVDVPALCYVWDDLDALAQRAVGRAK